MAISFQNICVHPELCGTHTPNLHFVFRSTPAQLRFALYIQLLCVFFIKFLCAKGVALSRIFSHIHMDLIHI